MKKFTKIFFIISLFVCLFYFTYQANAACEPGAQTDGDTVCIADPLGLEGEAPVQTLVGRVINAVLGVVGSLALAMFIYGGFVWMLAAGSSEKVKKGKDILMWAVVGLIVIFSAYALVNLVFTGLGV